MMKIYIWVFLASVLFPLFSFAQCPSGRPFLSFLSINTDVHSRGIGEIGVVSSGFAETDVAWRENPALLGGVGNSLAVESNYLTSDDSSFGDLINFKGHFSASSKIIVGLDATHLSSGLVFYNYNDVGVKIGERSPNVSVLTTSLGIRLNDHLSLGTGLTFYESNLYSDFVFFKGENFRTLLLQFGLQYNGERKMGNNNTLKMEGGLSLTNIGLKKAFENFSHFQNHLPAAVQLGGRIGWEKKGSKGKRIGVSLLTQIDYLLFPTCNFTDLDNNRIPDNFERSSWEVAASVLREHPGGLIGQLDYMTKRIALNPWGEISKNWKLGIALAYMNREGQSYFTTGLNAKYKNFQLDISNGKDSTIDTFGVPVWGVSLGYSKVLKNK